MTLLLWLLLWGAPPKSDTLRGPTCDDCDRPMIAPQHTVYAHPRHDPRGRGTR